MITTTLNDQNHISKNCKGSVIYFFILTEVPFVYMERVGFMTCTAASHQGVIKEPAASLWRTSETHPVYTSSSEAKSYCIVVVAHAMRNERAVAFMHILKSVAPRPNTALSTPHWQSEIMPTIKSWHCIRSRPMHWPDWYFLILRCLFGFRIYFPCGTSKFVTLNYKTSHKGQFF